MAAAPAQERRLSISLTLLLLAPFVGSFMGLLIRRHSDGRPVVAGRSACESCGTVLALHDLMPLISFALLRGRCRSCRMRIAAFHPAVEAASVMVPVWALAAGEHGMRLWFGTLLGWTLLVLAWIDWREMRLPDVLTLPLLLAGLGMTWAVQPDELTAHAAATALAWAGLHTIAAGYRRVRGRDGLGAGDAKLLAAGAAWVGLSRIAAALWLAAVLGICLALAWRLAGRRLHATTALPFGPCLALGIWLLWLYAGGIAGMGG